MKAARQIGMDAALKDVADAIAYARAEWPNSKLPCWDFVTEAVWHGSRPPDSIRPPQCAITVGRLRLTRMRRRAVP